MAGLMPGLQAEDGACSVRSGISVTSLGENVGPPKTRVEFWAGACGEIMLTIVLQIAVFLCGEI